MIELLIALAVCIVIGVLAGWHCRKPFDER